MLPEVSKRKRRGYLKRRPINAQSKHILDKYKDIKKLYTHNVMIYSIYILYIYIHFSSCLHDIYIYTQYTKLECYWTFSKSWCHTSDSLVPSSSMLDKHSKLRNMMHQCTSKALKLSVKWQLDSMIAYIFPGVEVVANFDNTRGQGRSNVTRCTASICVTPTCGCNRRSKIHLLAEKKISK